MTFSHRGHHDGRTDISCELGAGFAAAFSWFSRAFVRHWAQDALRASSWGEDSERDDHSRADGCGGNIQRASGALQRRRRHGSCTRAFLHLPRCGRGKANRGLRYQARSLAAGSGWNGKLQGIGNGGFAGLIDTMQLRNCREKRIRRDSDRRRTYGIANRCGLGNRTSGESRRLRPSRDS